MSQILFTSDTHFWHKNIIELGHRSYANLDEMHAALIANWNKCVKPDDSIYHLGDFSFGGPTKVESILKQLNGIKYLVRGNHDDSVLKDSCIKYFEWVKDIYYLKVPDESVEGGSQGIVLCHYPIASWQNMHHGAWHLHGHCHGTLPVDKFLKRTDVGVDNSCMRPVSYERLKDIMATREFRPVDHHGKQSGEAK